MFIGSELIEFLLCLGQVRSDADFFDLMLDTTRRLGFEQFAFVSHVDLVAAADEAVAISNYPDGWVERILTERYYLDDPVKEGCDRFPLCPLGYRDAGARPSTRGEGLARATRARV